MLKKTILATAIVLLATLGVLVWRPAGGTATLTSSFPVPVRVQRAIAHNFPKFAYLATRLPRGLHYISRSGVRGFSFTLWFDGRSPSLEYDVNVDCATQGSMQSFTLDGVDVSWSGDYNQQRAWRCITRGSTTFTVSASRSIQGDANPLAGNNLTPKQRRHALQLAQVVAYAKPIR